MSSEAVIYKEATLSDVNELALIMERAKAERDKLPLPQCLTGLQSADYVEWEMERPDAWTCLAKIGQSAVGVALGYPVLRTGGDAENIDTHHLSLLMVDPNYWGRGIGRGLLNLTIQHARQADRSIVSLWTRETKNDRTRRFYEQRGFVLTGVSDSEEHSPRVHYELTIKSSPAALVTEKPGKTSELA